MRIGKLTAHFSRKVTHYVSVIDLEINIPFDFSSVSLQRSCGVFSLHLHFNLLHCRLQITHHKM